MIRKLLEALFRHKLLLLLPPLIIPAIVIPVAFMNTPPVYEAAAGVWVDKPTYLNYRDGSVGWITEVQNQSGRLNELLRTRAFQVDVAQRTPTLAALVATPGGDVRVADLLARSVYIGSAGGAAPGADHLLLIRVQAPNGTLAYELCKAIVEAYQDKSALEKADQASIAVDFYTTRVQEAQQGLNRSTQNLRRYAASQAENPNSPLLSSPSQSVLPAAMLDPRLATLQASIQAAQADLTNAQAALNSAEQDAMAAIQGQQYGFQVMDAPRLPTRPTSQLRKLIVYPIAALVVGLGLSAMLLVLLVAGDRSARSEVDLGPGLRVVGNVPSLNLKRVPKKLRGVATRRAIGAPAGSSLPALAGGK